MILSRRRDMKILLIKVPFIRQHFTKLSLGQHNTTTVKDCGMLLESIYSGKMRQQGEASEEMLELLMNQKNTYKIPFRDRQQFPLPIRQAKQMRISMIWRSCTAQSYVYPCVMSQDFKNGKTQL